MEKFLSQYSEQIVGTVSCFDRIMFKGYLPLGWPAAMEGFMTRQGCLIKNFKSFVTTQSKQIEQHAQAVAERKQRPSLYLTGRQRKEDLARQIAEQDGIEQGLICVLRAVEPCQSFKMVHGTGRPRLVNAPRKCLCFYYYVMDREFGLMYVRIQAWFPLVIQIGLNGHEWLAKKMDQHGIAYRKLDNAFAWIDDCPRAQKFADRFAKKNWPRILSAFAARVNPLLKGLLAGQDYYWVMDQAEYATDVMFESAAALKGPYEEFLRYATLCLGAEDVLTFLGRKLTGHFQGEVLTDSKKKRVPGARVKHRMKENMIKMYDKFGCVLRVETVINNPREFKVRRQGKRNGELVVDWFPMAKGVAHMPRYLEVSLRANRRYLEALANVPQPGKSRTSLRRLAQPVRHNRRSYRGLNPARQDDVELMSAVLRGEHVLRGFTNADVRQQLIPSAAGDRALRRASQKTGRLLKLLHVHGLIARIPRSRRWRVTREGWSVMATILNYHHVEYPDLHRVLQAA